MKLLAQRFGMALPELEQSDEQRANAAERETLLKVHEVAAAWFREQLASHRPARASASSIADRGTHATRPARRSGSASRRPARDGLKQRASATRASRTALLMRAGLRRAARRRQRSIDRFRNRLMIPICRDTGSVIAFGGRAARRRSAAEVPELARDADLLEEPDALRAEPGKTAIRQRGFAVLVEGYFDFAQVYQAGIQAVVASCGTALTPQQAQQLRRFTSKVVLSFDPDAAGQGAAAKSCEMLVAEGFRGQRRDAARRRRSRHVRPEAGAQALRVNDCSSRSRIWSTCSTAPRPGTT